VIAVCGGWCAGLHARRTVCTALVVLTLAPDALESLPSTWVTMDWDTDACVDGHVAPPHSP